ncbi:MAG TPA: S8 family serine peptidase [Polyangiaceae bacterium]|nr:S8 family serine peptidase [Polyangiaceae bacterium]
MHESKQRTGPAPAGRPGAEPAAKGATAAPFAPGGARAVVREPTGDFRRLQKHLDGPPGIGAREAWATPGARGEGVRIIDVEWSWHFDHEDLGGRHDGVLAGRPTRNEAQADHGTAVLGVLGAQHNGYGVEGIVPHARLGAVALPQFCHDPAAFARPLAAAIRRATDLLGRGDLLVLAVHRPGPRHQFASRDDELGYVAVEWWPDVFAAVRRAVARGVVVVEAAGNGAEDLDDPLYDRPAPGFPAAWRNPFRPAHSSGAVLVAAGSPDDRVRMGISNFGLRVDAHGWGDNVVTTGYGDLQGVEPTRQYTYKFGGTSSAAAMVAGAIASVQGVLRQRGRAPLDAPAAARLLRSLRATPSPEGLIGNLPNVPQMIALALA